MNITQVQNGNHLTLSLEGRLDTNSAPDLETRIASLPPNPMHLTLDLAKLSYISSAGLRILLFVQKHALKNGGSLVVKNVGGAVKEVLEMTGFASILTLE